MTPKLSVIMANRDRAEFLPQALQSVQEQTEPDFELIMSDDGSSDSSVEITRDFMRSDTRIKLIETDSPGGPGAARNRAINVAQGDWIAVVDSDDLIEQDRFERLLNLARQQRAEAVADNLLYFGDPATEGRGLLDNYRGEGPWLLTASEFLRAHILRNNMPQMGYLKPIFHRTSLGEMRYDETLRIGEDTDLLLRFLMAGRRMIVTPELMYRYRRHPGSVSHRWKTDDLCALIENQKNLLRDIEQPELANIMQERLAGLERSLALEGVISHLKNKALLPALNALVQKPTLVQPLMKIVGGALFRKASAMAAR